MKHFRLITVCLFICLGLLFSTDALADSTVTFTGVGEVSFTGITAGGLHTCALGSDDKAYCWGDNYNGQLGDGTTVNKTNPVAVLSGALPVGVIFKNIAVGDSHTCALGDDDKAYCWGYNLNSQLGDGTTVNKTNPVAVLSGAIPAGVILKSIAAGEYHTCALGDDNKAYCWGYSNNLGQLGDGTMTNKANPVAVVSGVIPADVMLKSITVGGFHACVLGDDNKAYCRGSNNNGQLGDGTTTNNNSPVAVLSGAIPAGVILKSIVAGDSHTCALGDDDKTYCWGYNNRGQLGDGTTVNKTNPVAVLSGVLPVGVIFKNIAAGYYHTCAVGSDDKAYCRGSNNNGQLGDGTTTHNSSPVAVISGAIPAGVILKSISAGNSYTCALGDDNRAYCWGDNFGGQIGDGTSADRRTPVAVIVPLTPWSHIYMADVVSGSSLSGDLVMSGSDVLVVAYSGYVFSGWSDSTMNNPRSDLLSEFDIRVRATYTPIYLVTFVDYNGTVLYSGEIVYGTNATAPISPTRTGYIFSGWIPNNFTNITGAMIITGQYVHIVYTMSFDTASGNTIAPFTGYYMDSFTIPSAPSRVGYTFAGWSPVLPSIIPAYNQTFTATWNVNSSSSSSSSGRSRGGSIGSPMQDTCPNGDYSGNTYDGSCGKKPQESNKPIQKLKLTDKLISFNTTDIYNPSIDDGYCFTRKSDAIITNSIKIYTTEEFQKSLMFLYSYDMTIFNSVDNFDPYRALTRQEAAKIFTNFATNVLCRTADKNLQPTYADINDADPSLKKYIISAYQLGLMKGGDDTTFRPFDTITKAEFNAVLVRMILHSYLSENISTNWYSEYNKVSEKLGIIKYGADNTSVIRNDASLMLFRAYKNQEFLLQDGNSNSYVLLDHAEFVK